MGVATAPPPESVPAAPIAEGCPLCGSPIGAEQEWCLRCGAAARTRLAATPRWQAPVIALVVVIVLSLGALAAALVSLAGDSSSPASTVAVTRTVIAPAARAPAPTSAAAPTTGTPSTASGTKPTAGTPSTASPTTTPTVTPTVTSGAAPTTGSTPATPGAAAK